MVTIKTKIHHSLLIFLLLLIGFRVLPAQENVTIEGYVLDKQTGEALPGTNIFLEGTGIGGSSDLSGKYTIANVSPGSYTIHVVYVGYQEVTETIEVKSGETLEKHFELTPVALEGETITVTAQASGQMAAINQQLSAEAIVNVVSSSQIQELPDANAAESLRRMPGISITRYGGEGNQVVIRGIAPKYNVITIDGVRMTSSNPSDRSTDLSMISSTMLEGIEVSKTVTADQDADVFGGTVNFKMREAKSGERGLGLRLLAQGGYTGLSNANDKFRNYKIVPSIEGRFFDDQFGVFIEANIERRNLSSNSLSAQYTNRTNNLTDYITQSITLNNIPRDRTRYNGAIVLDYQLPVGKVSLSNFLSSSTTELENRNEVLSINAGPGTQNQHIYELAYSKSKLSMIYNSLNYQAELPFINVDLKLSHNYSETDNPEDWAVRFYQVPAGIATFDNQANVDPRDVADVVFTDAENTNLYTVSTYNNFARERALTAALNLELPLNISSDLTTVIKFGGKYKNLKRSYDSEVYGTNATFVSPSARGASQLIVDYFGIPTSDPTRIPLSFFIDDQYSYGDFLDNEFTMHNPMQYELIKSLVDFCRANVETFASAGASEAFARNNYLSTTNNYSGKEILTAAYIMATINIGNDLKIIPGIRYQNLQTTYSGVRGLQSPLSYYVYYHPDDTTVTLNHPYWLPNLNIRYKPLSWFDIRLGYSNTISYPDYNAIIPRIDVTTSANLAWNNYLLEPSKSKNYDIYCTFSENRIGLFTIGGFFKKISNLIYPWRFSKPGIEAKPYFLPSRDPSPRLLYTISTYINNPYVVDNLGFEIEWQTHFWYLPDPLKGLVLDVNYTHVSSEADYPYVIAGNTSLTNIDTSFTDRLIYQPNHILNLTLGYDFRDFSIRVSFLYQDDVFTGVSQWPQLRSNTAAYRRWDIALKQKLPWYGLQAYANINNLNNAKDLNILQMYTDIPRTIEHYGMTAELGLRWEL